MEYFENNASGSWQRDIYVVICILITRLSSGCRNLHSECKATYI